MRARGEKLDSKTSVGHVETLGHGIGLVTEGGPVETAVVAVTVQTAEGVSCRRHAVVNAHVTDGVHPLERSVLNPVELVCGVSDPGSARVRRLR